MRQIRLVVIASFSAACLLVGSTTAAGTPAGAPVSPPPTIAYPVHMDVSAPLIGENEDNDRDVDSVRGKDREPKKFRDARGNGRSATPGVTTSAVSAPNPGASFEGVGQGFSGPAGTFMVNAAPPDPNGAVGPNHYVETVNTSFAIFSKSGTALYGPKPINTLWSGFGGGCQTNNDGDPMVLYDRLSDRWIISQFSVSTTPYLQCVAVSTSGDPTGTYFRYSYSYSAFPDYPKFAVWPDGYYVTFNMFTPSFFGYVFNGAKACSYDRASMLTGAGAAQICFNTSSSYGGLLPSTLDGARQPPAGSPNYLVSIGASANTLAYWQFHSDFVTPANSTFTGPNTLGVDAFSEACGGGTCIPQAGTSQQLDSLADRLMYRLAYRNFGDREALVVNHSIAAGSSVGVRWYELRVGAGNTLNVYQQGTYAPDASYRWMGSVAMDQAGNIGLGYSVSSAAMKPAIRYTGRLAGDPAGTMSQAEGSIIEGTGSQTGSNLSRWGDYTSLAVDPLDDCTFWYTNEYLSADGAFNWHTRVGTFKFAGCGTPPGNDFSISASPSSVSVQQGQSGQSTISTAVTSGTAETVTLSASGLPTGASATFNPASVSAGAAATLTIATASNTPTGSYTVTVTGTAPSATHATPIALTVTAPPPAPGADPIANGGFETGNLSGWTASGSTATSTTSHTGAYAARVGSPSPFSGDSSIAQTFTVPAGRTQLSFWYRVVCTDSVRYDWATATLRDNTTGTTSTILPRTCTNTGAWSQRSAGVTPGHSYTLRLIDHDDNFPGDPTYTLFDDVTVQ